MQKKQEKSSQIYWLVLFVIILYYSLYLMLKTPKNQSTKEPLSSTIYNLTINKIKFHQQHLKSISEYISFSIYGKNDQLLKETPIISFQSPQVWNFSVNLPNPKFMLFSELDHTNIGVRRKELIGTVILNIDKQSLGIFSARNKSVLVCEVNYELVQQKRNRFINNSDIFSDVEEQPLKPRKNAKPNLDMTFERKIYHQPDSVIIDQQRPGTKIKKLKNIFDTQEDKTVLIKVQEASRILEESMRKSEDERRIFSKYLDDSTSYVNELMKSYENKQSAEFQRMLDFSTINQDRNQQDEYISTQQKWYTRKFHKNHIKQKSQLRKQKVQSKQGKVQEQPKKALLSYIDENYVTRNDLKKMISDLIVDVKQNNKPKEINFATIENQNSGYEVFVRMVKDDREASHLWRISVPVDLDKGLQISCIGEKEELVGCIGKEQEKQGKCLLFDNSGNMKGMLHFKCKQIGQTIVQTQYIIPTEIDPDANQKKEEYQNNNNTSTNTNNQTYFSALNSKRRQKQGKIHSKKDLLKVSNVVPQLTNQELETDSCRQNTKKMEKQQKDKIIKPELITIDNKSPKSETVSPVKTLQQSTKLQTQSASKLQFTLTNQASLDQQIRKRSNITNHKDNTDEKAQTFIVGQKSKINSIRFPPYVPMKPGVDSPKQKNSKSGRKKIILNEQEEESTFKKSIASEPVQQSNYSLKINNVDVRLNKPNYSGKFLRLEVNGQAVPYYTETSKQLYLLTWKGKGYLFRNIPQEAVLKISLLEQTDGMPQQLGFSQISLSQLKLISSGFDQIEKMMTDKNGQEIGKLILIYEFFSKKSQQLQSLMGSPSSSKKKIKSLKQSKTYIESSRYKYQSSRLASSTAVGGTPKNKDSRVSGIRIKSNMKKQLTPQKIQLHDYVFDRLKEKNQKLSESSLRFKKYLGGNIIIPKAPRFKSMGHQESLVGPGAYQAHSQFERHAVQL